MQLEAVGMGDLGQTSLLAPMLDQLIQRAADNWEVVVTLRPKTTAVAAPAVTETTQSSIVPTAGAALIVGLILVGLYLLSRKRKAT